MRNSVTASALIASRRRLLNWEKSIDSPLVRTTWAEWRKRYPDTMVLKPMPGYADRIPAVSKRIKDATRVGPDGAPKGALALDARLPARETVAGLEVGRDTVAYPFSALRIARVVNDRVGGLPVVIVHQPSSDTTTAFDARAKGKVQFWFAWSQFRPATRVFSASKH